MKTILSLDADVKLTKPVVTIGSFDGVHAGHRVLLSTVKDYAKKIGGESVVVTFYPHPKEVLLGKGSVKELNTLSEKLYLLKDFGIDAVVVMSFTKEFSATPYDKFIEDILVGKIGVECLVVGYDNSFGHAKNGDFKSLNSLGERLGFSVVEVPCHYKGDKEVSSTEIRDAIIAGDMSLANSMLSKGYIMEVTIDGDDVLIDSASKLLPTDGRYEVSMLLDNEVVDGVLTISENGKMTLDNRAGVDGKVMLLFK